MCEKYVTECADVCRECGTDICLECADACDTCAENVRSVTKWCKLEYNKKKRPIKGLFLVNSDFNMLITSLIVSSSKSVLLINHQSFYLKHFCSITTNFL
jgi:hypothetical protein